MKDLENVIFNGESYAIAMERGGGKTCLCVTMAMLAILGGYHFYVALVAADKDAAEELLAGIKTELEVNDRLLEDFPEVCYPIREMEGIGQRARGQTCLGVRTRLKWDADEIHLPTIEGSKVSGSTIKCRGITGRIRGMQRTLSNGKVIRPTLAIADDPQTDESAGSFTQTRTRVKIIRRTIRRLAGEGKKTAVVVPCTVIEQGDAAQQVTDRELMPEYHGRRFKVVYEFPKNIQLWEGRYDELRREGIKAEDGIEAATQYYRRNRKKMDAGAKVAWPARFDRDAGEISALQYAMNLFLEDRDGFMSECQNEPASDQDNDSDILSSDQIVTKLNGYRRGAVPTGADCLVATIDVQSNLLYYTVAAFSKSGFSGDIVEYGSFPKQAGAYFTYRTARDTLSRRFKGAGLEGRIFQGLTELVDQYLGRKEWAGDDGAIRRVDVIGIDSRYQKDAVFNFARQSDFANIILPTQGLYIGAKTDPLTERQPKKGERIGDFWVEVTDPDFRIRKVRVDTNFAKTFLHARFATGDGDAGALRLYGRIGSRKVGATHHKMVADHYAAERAVKTAGRGRELYEWYELPSKPDNHLLDTAVGAIALASREGCRLTTDPPRRRRRRKVKATLI